MCCILITGRKCKWNALEFTLDHTLRGNLQPTAKYPVIGPQAKSVVVESVPKIHGIDEIYCNVWLESFH